MIDFYCLELIIRQPYECLVLYFNHVCYYRAGAFSNSHNGPYISIPQLPAHHFEDAISIRAADTFRWDIPLTDMLLSYINLDSILLLHNHSLLQHLPQLFSSHHQKHYILHFFKRIPRLYFLLKLSHFDLTPNRFELFHNTIYFINTFFCTE